MSGTEVSFSISKRPSPPCRCFAGRSGALSSITSGLCENFASRRPSLSCAALHRNRISHRKTERQSGWNIVEGVDLDKLLGGEKRTQMASLVLRHAEEQYGVRLESSQGIVNLVRRPIPHESPKVAILSKIARRRVRNVDARELEDWEVDSCFRKMAGNHGRKRGLPMRRDANASSLDVWERAFCHLRLIVNCGVSAGCPLSGGSDGYGSPLAEGAGYSERRVAHPNASSKPSP